MFNDPTNGQFVSSNEASDSPIGLTERQERFAHSFVNNGGNKRAAAVTAGYEGTGEQAAFLALRNPKVRARIHELVQIKFETKGGVVGYGVLMEIAQDRSAPPGVRRHCARDLLELAGFYKDKDSTVHNARKSLAEMSRAELEEVVAFGAAVLRAANKTPNDAQPPIDVTPKPLETLDK